MKVGLVWVLFSALVPSLALADKAISYEKVDGWLEKLGGDNRFDADKKIDWGVLPGPFSTPELGVGLGTAVIGLYRPDENDTLSQNSSIAIKGFVSSTGAFGVNLENYNFFDNDKKRLFIDAYANHMPTYYWGIGDSNGRRKSNKEKYTVRDFSFQPKGLINVANVTYAGLGLDFSVTKAGNFRKETQSLIRREKGGTSITSSGISAHLFYDSRDFVPNPSEGRFAGLAFTHYSKALASDWRFNRLIGQYSAYRAFNNSVNDVIAFEVYGELTEGDVPWNELALLGNHKRMRGYYEGRYRDRNMLSTQVEYRRKLNWRHGMTLWAGAGTLSADIDRLGSQRWLPTVGAGYRFEFKPGMNVRLDYGVGKNSSGFYFQVGEAF